LAERLQQQGAKAHFGADLMLRPNALLTNFLIRYADTICAIENAGDRRFVLSIHEMRGSHFASAGALSGALLQSAAQPPALMYSCEPHQIEIVACQHSY
jgi:hypothetical protein